MIGLTGWPPDLTAMQVSSKCRAASAHAGRTQAPSHAISGLQDLQLPADGQEEQQPSRRSAATQRAGHYVLHAMGLAGASADGTAFQVASIF